MDLTSLIEYYQRRLIIQYRMKTKAKNTIALMTGVVSGDGLALELARCFDLDTAIGEQLDIVGRIVGVSRYVYGLDLAHQFFSFVTYADSTPREGFGRYLNDPYPDALWLRYIQNSSLQMSDFELRECIRLKIIKNNSPENLKDVSEALYASFGNNIYLVDNKDMTITYHSTDAYRRILTIAEYAGLLPKPMGVSIELVTESISSSSCSSSSSCRSSSSSSRSSSSSSCRSSSSSSSSAT